MQFFESRLDNGLQIIAELNPHVHSVAVAFFVNAGARDEGPGVSGVSHFLEHMAFKGAGDMTADDVNRMFDDVGANYNASTGEEITQYYAAILPEYLPQTLNLLAGLIRPSLREADFDVEKQVILEEIGMYADMPNFTVYEQALQRHFAEHPLGQPILGTIESIKSLKVEQMREYHREHYSAGNILLAVAGNTTWEEVLRLARETCSDWPAGKSPRSLTPPKLKPSTTNLRQPGIQQQHVMTVIPAPPAEDDLRYAADILSVIVGDDSGSRLYWEIVDPGYADSADIAYAEYEGTGVYLSYIACAPEEAEANLARFRHVLDDIQQNGVTEQELQQAKNKVASRIVLSGERPMGRLSSLGGNWLYRQEYRSVQQDLDTVESITQAQIRELLDKFPLIPCTTCGLGPVEES